VVGRGPVRQALRWEAGEDRVDRACRPRNADAWALGRLRGGADVLDYCGWHWYINQPASVAPIVEDIGKYLKFFDPRLVWTVKEKSHA
jgi:hypothetical protein